MPLPLALIGGAASLLGGILGNKGKKKAAKAQAKAQANAMRLKHNMGEDRRLANVGLGSSILGKINPSRNAAIDPALLAQLSQRRDYDFEGAVGDPTAGQDTSFLGELAGGAGDLLGEMDLFSKAPGGVQQTAQTILPPAGMEQYTRPRR
jgi:hypothetical protein